MSARVACWLCYILEKLSVTHNQTVTNDFPVILLVIQLHLLLFSSYWTGIIWLFKYFQMNSDSEHQSNLLTYMSAVLLCYGVRAVHLKWPYSGFEENVWDKCVHWSSCGCISLSPPLFRNNANIKSCCLRIQHSLLKAQNTSLFDLTAISYNWFGLVSI